MGGWGGWAKKKKEGTLKNLPTPDQAPTGQPFSRALDMWCQAQALDMCSRCTTFTTAGRECRGREGPPTLILKIKATYIGTERSSIGTVCFSSLLLLHLYRFCFLSFFLFSSFLLPPPLTPCGGTVARNWGG